MSKPILARDLGNGPHKPFGSALIGGDGGHVERCPRIGPTRRLMSEPPCPVCGNKSAWRNERARHHPRRSRFRVPLNACRRVGSAALFDCSPYLTRFELWHRRKGNIDSPDLSGVERVEWGLRLEPAIIAAAADRWGYQLEETPRRLSNGRGLGGHPDQLATDERGPGIIEIKTADWLVFKQWGSEPPEHYLLQAIAYAGLAGRSWCDVLVLVGGNRLERFCYDFRPKIYAEIERASPTSGRASRRTIRRRPITRATSTRSPTCTARARTKWST
jgi:hypothetical protein